MNKPFTADNVKAIFHTWFTDKTTDIIELLNQRAEQWHSEQSGWVKCSDRLPTGEDASETGNVEVWVNMGKNSYSETVLYPRASSWEYSHWRKIVKPE